jgi:predicted DNA-binding protein (MmcQ/YjbR family)
MARQITAARSDASARIFARPVFARARRVCLALPAATEACSHDHPVFRAGAKTFCAFEMHWGRPSIAVRVPIAQFDRQVEAGRIFATPYGRGAWTSVWMDGEVDWTELTALIRRAYDGVAPRRIRSPRSAR